MFYGLVYCINLSFSSGCNQYHIFINYNYSLFKMFRVVRELSWEYFYNKNFQIYGIICSVAAIYNHWFALRDYYIYNRSSWNWRQRRDWNMNVAQFLFVLVAVHFTSASLQEYHCNHNVKEQDVSWYLEQFLYYIFWIGRLV